MSEANPERGEVPITLDGKAYPMRPSYEAMRAIERQTNSSLQALSLRLGDPWSGLSLEQMSIIVSECIRAAGKERGDQMLLGVGAERVGELIYAGGVLPAANALEQLLVNALSGGVPPKKSEAASASTSEASNTEG